MRSDIDSKATMEIVNIMLSENKKLIKDMSKFVSQTEHKNRLEVLQK
jgi:hypothetical protein